MNRISTCFASLLLSCALTAQAQQYQLNSPDGKLIVNIEAGQTTLSCPILTTIAPASVTATPSSPTTMRPPSLACTKTRLPLLR